MRVNFFNVTITVEAESEEAAYRQLNNVMAFGFDNEGLKDWSSDVFTTDSDETERDTLDIDEPTAF